MNFDFFLSLDVHFLGCLLFAPRQTLKYSWLWRLYSHLLPFIKRFDFAAFPSFILVYLISMQCNILFQSSSIDEHISTLTLQLLSKWFFYCDCFGLLSLFLCISMCMWACGCGGIGKKWWTSHSYGLVLVVAVINSIYIKLLIRVPCLHSFNSVPLRMASP